MAIYVCKACEFLFERVFRPDACPNCGKDRVEYADIHGKIDYLKRKEARLAESKANRAVKSILAPSKIDAPKAQSNH